MDSPQLRVLEVGAALEHHQGSLLGAEALDTNAILRSHLIPGASVSSSASIDVEEDPESDL